MLQSRGGRRAVRPRESQVRIRRVPDLREPREPQPSTKPQPRSLEFRFRRLPQRQRERYVDVPGPPTLAAVLATCPRPRRRASRLIAPEPVRSPYRPFENRLAPAPGTRTTSGGGRLPCAGPVPGAPAARVRHIFVLTLPFSRRKRLRALPERDARRAARCARADVRVLRRAHAGASL